MVTAKDLVGPALKSKGMKYADFACILGWTPQKLSRKLAENNFRFDDFVRAVGKIGYEVALVPVASGKDGDGAEDTPKEEANRIKKRVRGVTYDTGKATLVASSATNDEPGTELYLDREGRYFFVEGEEQVLPVSRGIATAFTAQYREA